MSAEQNEGGCGCGCENKGNAGGGNSDGTLAMLCHLLALSGYLIPLGAILGPLILWLVKREESAAVAYHGKESLNFQISCMIYAVGCLILSLIGIGIVLIVVLVIFWTVMTIIAAVKAKNGVEYRYPLCLRLIK